MTSHIKIQEETSKWVFPFDKQVLQGCIRWVWKKYDDLGKNILSINVFFFIRWKGKNFLVQTVIVDIFLFVWEETHIFSLAIFYLGYNTSKYFIFLHSFQTFFKKNRKFGKGSWKAKNFGTLCATYLIIRRK